MKTTLLLAGVTLIACAKKQDPAPPPPAPKAEAPKTQAVLQLEEEKPAAAVIDAGEEKLQLIAVEHARPPAKPEEPPPDASDEAGWRKRFHDAHERVDGLEMRVAKAQELVGNADYGKTLEGATGLPSHFPPGYGEAKQLLEHADEEREAGKRALEDLEHEAANAGIPLEWRR